MDAKKKLFALMKYQSCLEKIQIETFISEKKGLKDSARTSARRRNNNI